MSEDIDLSRTVYRAHEDAIAEAPIATEIEASTASEEEQTEPVWAEVQRFVEARVPQGRRVCIDGLDCYVEQVLANRIVLAWDGQFTSAARRQMTLTSKARKAARRKAKR